LACDKPAENTNFPVLCQAQGEKISFFQPHPRILSLTKYEDDCHKAGSPSTTHYSE